MYTQCKLCHIIRRYIQQKRHVFRECAFHRSERYVLQTNKKHLKERKHHADLIYFLRKHNIIIVPFFAGKYNYCT
jgi:hypothetical protein